MNIYETVLIVSWVIFVPYCFYVPFNIVRSNIVSPQHIFNFIAIYYTLPLATLAVFPVDGLDLFLHAQASDQNLAIESLLYLYLTLFFFNVAFNIPKRSSNQIEIFIHKKNIRYFNYMIFILTISLFLGIFIYGYSAFMSGYQVMSESESARITSGPLIYISMQWIGLIMALKLMLMYKINIKISVFNYIFIVFIVLLFFINGKRLELAVLLFSIYVSLKSVGAINKKTELLFICIFFIAFSVLGVVRIEGVEISVLSLIWNTLGEGVNAGHYLPAVIFDIGDNYNYGMNFLRSIFMSIPRYIFPEKDILREFMTLYQPSIALAPMGAKHFIGEWIIDGGVISVILYSSVFGYVSSYLYKFNESGLLPVRKILWLVLCAVLLPHLRDGMEVYLKLAIQTSIFLFIILFLLKARFFKVNSRLPIK